MMNVNQMKYFEVLAKTEHYGEASEKLFISQPSLSYGISKLEDTLGVKLFNHVGRNIKLSEAGKVLLPFVQSALIQIEQGEKALQNWKTEETAKMNIGFIDFLAVRYIPQLIQQFDKQQIQFDLYRSTTKNIVKNIKNGDYDIGFCSYTDDPSLNLIPVMQYKFMALMPKKHPLAKQESILLSELAKWPLVTYRDTISLGVTVKEMLAKSKIPLVFKNYYEDDLVIGGIVSQSQTVAIVGDSPTYHQFDDLVRIPLNTGEENFVRIIYMVYLNSTLKNDKISQFIDQVKKFKYEE
jgi:DNA-binding transcriptional LysR family regulator